MNISITAIAGTLLLYIVLLIWINRAYPRGDKITILKAPKNLADKLEPAITLTIWNIGYAGLGKGSDFVIDGGKNWFPPSTEAVKTNLAGILENLSALKSQNDLIMLQEVSQNSPLSLWQPVRKSILNHLNQFYALFRPDISSRGLPWPLKINHGTLTLSKAQPRDTDIIKLPAEPTYLAGLIKRNYALLVTRFNIKNSSAQWVLINLHLAAFDQKGTTRFKQFEALFAFAKKEYANGHYVVLGGDWNMALTKSDFAHKTDLEMLFWLVTLPKDKIPSGWQVAFDPEFPTVRTNYQPYVKGENYTAIIDGFIVSPNVRIKSISTTNTNFTHTDHMPVTGTFCTKPTQ